MDEFCSAKEASQLLREQPPLKQHHARREYWAAVYSKFKAAKKAVDEPIGKGYSLEDRVRFLDNLIEIFFHEQLVRRQVLDFMPNILKASAWESSLKTISFPWRLNLWHVPDDKALDLAVALLKTEIDWPGYEDVIVPNQVYFNDLLQKCDTENVRNSSTSRIEEVLNGAPARNPDVPPEQRPSLDVGNYTKKRLSKKPEMGPKAEKKAALKAEDHGSKADDTTSSIILSPACTSESVVACSALVTEELVRTQRAANISVTMADFQQFLVSQKAVRMLPVKQRHSARRSLWADMYAKFKAARREVQEPFEFKISSQARVVTWDNVLDVFANEYIQRRQVLEMMALMLRVPEWAESLASVSNIWRLDLWNHADQRTVDLAVVVLKTNANWVGYEGVVAPNREFFADVLDKCETEKVSNKAVDRIGELLDGAEPINPTIPNELRPSLEPGAYDSGKSKRPRNKVDSQYSRSRNSESERHSSARERLKPERTTKSSSSSNRLTANDGEKKKRSTLKPLQDGQRDDEARSRASTSRRNLSVPLRLNSRSGSRESKVSSKACSASRSESCKAPRQRSREPAPLPPSPKQTADAKSAASADLLWSDKAVEKTSLNALGITVPGNPSGLAPPDDEIGEVGLQHYKNLARVDLRRRLTEVLQDTAIITEYLTYWQKWMEDRIETKVPRKHTNMSDVEARERKLQAELWRTVAFEEVLYLDGGWFTHKKDDCNFLNCVGTVGDQGNNCVVCGELCYTPPLRLGKHRPRYCEVCHAWYCGDCKKKGLQKGRRRVLPGYGSFEIHRCKKPECERGTATVPLDPGTGGVLRDHVFIVMQVEKWKTKKG